MVITADCDFAHEKHAGRVTCVPLLTEDDYLLEIRFALLQAKLCVGPLETLQSAAKQAGASTITKDEILSWVVRSDATSVADSLASEKTSAKQLIPAVQAIKRAHLERPTAELKLEDLVESQLLHNSAVSRQKAVERVKDFVAQTYSSTPGDALFLGAFDGHTNVGFFAYLRHIELVWQTDVATGFERGRKYRRVAALNERFSNALAQRFALVYMPIALPADYEASREESASNMTRRLQ